ncbi:MAG: hypothetical protein Q8Q39_00485 [bacterium]|nr:hypothetical protein [bacterium]
MELRENPHQGLRRALRHLPRTKFCLFCAPQRDVPRTWDKLIERLVHWFTENAVPKLSGSRCYGINNTNGVEKGKGLNLAA